MKLSGSAEVAGSPSEAFDRLLDPDLLQRCIPGCERMEAIGEGRYETLVSAGVGPVKGRFEGIVTLDEVERPTGYRMLVEGKSSVGHVQGEAQLSLEADGEDTIVRYDGQATISGLLATVGGRLIDAGARKVARQFFEKLAAEVGEAGTA